MVNFLFDPSQTPHVPASQIWEHFGLSSSTMQAKSKQIRDLLGMSHPRDAQRDAARTQRTEMRNEHHRYIWNQGSSRMASRHSSRGSASKRPTHSPVCRMKAM